jgi:hypothetical protein
MIKLTVNSMAVVVLITFLGFVSTNINQPYSSTVYEYFSEPVVRVLAYLGVFALAEYNPVISLLALMALVMLHIDYNNLSTPLKIYP